MGTYWLGIDMDDPGALLQRAPGQPGSGIDGAGGTHREQQVAGRHRLPGSLPGLLRQAFTEPHHTRTGQAVTQRATGRSQTLAILHDLGYRNGHGAGAIEQRGCWMLPCRWITERLPARSCRSTTFWVTTCSCATCPASSAMARWAGLGATCARRA